MVLKLSQLYPNDPQTIFCNSMALKLRTLYPVAPRVYGYECLSVVMLFVTKSAPKGMKYAIRC